MIVKDELMDDGNSRSPEYKSESTFYRFNLRNSRNNRPYFKIQQGGYGTNFMPANQLTKSSSPINRCLLLNSTKKSNLTSRKNSNIVRGAITLNSSLKISKID